MNTRERVLKSLLTSPRITINELAEQVGIHPISVRHHINKLEADGLVHSDEELHGVGRPRRVYFLTENGLEHFPTRYMRLAVRLLEQLKETMPKPAVNQLFTQMAQELVADYSSEAHTDGLSMEERLEVVQKLLLQEGFNIEWEQQGEEYHIREINCPYLQVSQNHPEVCAVDQTLISALLEVPAHKVKCVLNGDNYCTYVVSNSSVTESEKE